MQSVETIAPGKSKLFPVIEIFGPTIQGEGALAGRVTHFVRFGGCDYRCAWCDSGYAVLPKEVRANSQKMSTDEITERIVLDLCGQPEWVTLSGGNPALHDLTDLVNRLHELKFKVAVETQGTIWKQWLRNVDQLTVSPKPPSSGMKNSAPNLVGFMDNIRNEYGDWGIPGELCLKIPVFDETDYLFAHATHQLFPEIPFYLSVVTLMGGLDGHFGQGSGDSGAPVDTRETLLDRYKWLAERTAGDSAMGDVTVIPQLHALIWGHGRGF